MDDCIFCKIAAGKASAKILFQDERVTAFRDAHPVMPVHVLIIPNQHIESMNDVRPDDVNLLGYMTVVAGKLAEAEGIASSGYRLVINTGKNAGQSIFHLHMHLLGGKSMPFRFDVEH